MEAPTRGILSSSTRPAATWRRARVRSRREDERTHGSVSRAPSPLRIGSSPPGDPAAFRDRTRRGRQLRSPQVGSRHEAATGRPYTRKHQQARSPGGRCVLSSPASGHASIVRGLPWAQPHATPAFPAASLWGRDPFTRGATSLIVKTRRFSGELSGVCIALCARQHGRRRSRRRRELRRRQQRAFRRSGIRGFGCRHSISAPARRRNAASLNTTASTGRRHSASAPARRRHTPDAAHFGLHHTVAGREFSAAADSGLLAGDEGGGHPGDLHRPRQRS